MVQVPTATKRTVEPVTVHAGEPLVNTTVRPEVAVAAAVYTPPLVAFVGAVDDAVVVRQAQDHHRADDDRVLAVGIDHHRPLHDLAHPQDPHLGLVDDRRAEQVAEHRDVVPRGPLEEQRRSARRRHRPGGRRWSGHHLSSVNFRDGGLLT